MASRHLVSNPRLMTWVFPITIGFWTITKVQQAI
jgi:hypothetical protein